MPATVNHNYGITPGGVPPMLAVPIVGTTRITILDSSNETVGTTSTSKDGRWRDSITLQDGTYKVQFRGNFRPIGVGFKGHFTEPVTFDEVTILVPLTGPTTPPSTGGDGATGATGSTGPPGQDGIIGVDGATGATGPEGPTGPRGTDGVIGVDGSPGATGSTGASGPAGPAGAQGPQGPAGPVGTACDLELGTPGDGTFLDGFFQWTSDVATCDAIDDLNEIIKNLAPSQPPAVNDLNGDFSGVTGDLSFDASNPINLGDDPTGPTGAYVPVTGGVGDLTTVAVDDPFTVDTISNRRRGILDATTNTTGTINYDGPTGPGSPYPAYPAEAFGPGDEGDLKLELNGTVVHAVDLSTFGSGSTVNAYGSGFNLSVSSPVLFPSGTPLDSFQYRTGTWTVDYSDPEVNLGWNYIRVVHTIDAVDTGTTYVDWVVDGNQAATSYSGLVFDNLIMTGSTFLSGINYHTGGTADYDVTISNGQRNTYIQPNAISFSTTNCSASGTSFSDTSGNELQDTVLTDVNVIVDSSGCLVDATLSIATNVDRTIDANENNPSSSSTIPGILLYGIASSSTDLSNGFDDEDYRIQGSGTDFNTNLTSNWTESESLVGASAGHNEGLQVLCSELVYPDQDFRNTTDSGPIDNGPSGNPDYSGATGTRYFFGYWTDATDSSNFRLTIQGSATLVADNASLSGDDFSLCLRWATQSGWLDVTKDFIEGQWGSTSETYDATSVTGCYAETFGNDKTVPTTNLGITIGTRDTSSSFTKVYYRIKAPSGWTGELTSISIEWGVTS